MNIAYDAAQDVLTQGYGVLPAFAETHELAPLRDAVDAIASHAPDPVMARPGNHLFPLRWNDAVVARFLAPPRRRKLLQNILRASDLRFLSAYISTKDPRTPALWWHQDWWAWDHPISFRRAPAQVALLCYLSDTSHESGALRVLPGSHVRSTGIHALLPEAHGADANDVGAAHPAMCDTDGQVTLEVKAGDAVLLDYRLLHGTHANLSARRRDCVLLSFIPGWRELPDDILAHLIMHPALPGATEDTHGCDYRDLIPAFDGVPASLPINRIPPAQFQAVD
jgi:phytanoyl-CoA dioxygenase PhyH